MNENYNIMTKSNNLPTVGELKEILKRFPDDWPMVWQVFEGENINSLAVGLGLNISIEQITIVMHLLNAYKSLWIDSNFLKNLIKQISGENHE